MILQKIPPKLIREVPFDTMQGRSLLYTVSKINGQDLVVGTSHLESYAQSFRIREKQLKIAYEQLKDYKNVILMGDFNLELEVDEKSISPDYQDLWPTFHQDIGHTWFMGQYSHRLDRVIVKRGDYRADWNRDKRNRGYLLGLGREGRSEDCFRSFGIIFNHQIIIIIVTMNASFLNGIISHKSFKIDTLLPNYLIYSKLHPDDSEATSQFDMIMLVIRGVFQKVLKFYINAIKRDMVPKKLQISQQINDEIEDLQLDELIRNQLKMDLQVFLYGLSQIQDVYTEFFKIDFFTLVERKDILDDRINLNWFVDELRDMIVDYLGNTIGTAKGLLYHIILEQLDYKEFINYLNKIISQIFNDCAQHLKEMVNDFQKQTNQCSLANKYLLLGLFQELSNRAYDLINDYQDYSIYHYSNQDSREEFARLIINHFDHLQLYVSRNDEEILTPFQQKISEYLKQNQDEIEVIEKTLKMIVQKGETIITHKIISKLTHKTGLLIEVQQQKLRFILHKPHYKFVITNAKLVLNRWMYEEALQNLNPEQLLQKKEEATMVYSSIEQAFHSVNFQGTISQQEEQFELDEQIAFHSGNQQTSEVQSVITQSMHMNQMAQVTPFSAAAGDIGASLGNCLANINKYSSRKQFLADFGQSAAISGTITYIANQMPVVGQIVALGGFGYFTMKIYSNETASQHGKNTQMNKLMISTTANIGSGIGGAIIGQALIPIPFLGALIGGIVGGIIGGTSSSKLLEYMSEKRFEQLFQFLQEKQIKGYWEYDEELLDKLGLSIQIFEDNLPNNLQFDEQRNQKWITMIIYVYLTVYQQQQDNLELKKIEENQENNQETQAQLEFKEVDVIELALKWIIYERCLLGLTLDNVQKIIRCIFQNL